LKAAVMDINGVTIKEVEVPSLENGDLLVAMKSCGLCGTDLEKMEGQYTASKPILGHEPAGVIKVSGDPQFKEGERVFVHHHVPCYQCYYCMNGSPTMCPHYRESNIYPGGFSEMFRVPSWNVKRRGVLKLPDSVSFRQATFVEPLATVVRAQRRASLREGEKVLVIGAGPMGLLHAAMAKLTGSDVILADVSEYRLRFAERLGHKVLPSREPNDILQLTEGRGADLSIVASGSPSAILYGLKSTRRGGRVLLFGVPYKGTILDYDVSDLLNREISVIPSNAAVEEDTREALNLIAQGKVKVDSLITHAFRLEQFHEAVRVAKQREAVKVVIEAN